MKSRATLIAIPLVFIVGAVFGSRLFTGPPVPSSKLLDFPNLQPLAVSEAHDSRSLAVMRFDWGQIESSDYQQYIANLRAIKCPEATIRDIIIADVNRLYWPRLSEIRTPLRFWECKKNLGIALSRTTEVKRREIEKEKAVLLERLLGVDPDHDLLQVGGQPDRFDQAVGFLPLEKQPQVRALLAKYAETEENIHLKAEGVLTSQDRNDFSNINKVRREELERLLSSEELEQYDLYTSDTARNMRAALTVFEPSEEEFRQVYRIKRQFDDQFEQVWDRDHSDPTSFARRAQAERQVEKEIEAALGSERYREYTLAQDYTYRGLVEVLERLDRPREIADQVFNIKQEVDQISRNIMSNRAMAEEQRQPLLQRARQQAAESVRELIGDEALRLYQKRGGLWLSSIPQ